MEFVRTPEDRFANLPGYPFAPHYVDVGGLRLHYLDEGSGAAAPVLLLHGEPSWSYLYRKMIGPIVAAGFRAIAPDLIGFGRSDKPIRREDYTYQGHVDWIASFITQLGLSRIHLVCQDWGGLIGLRLVAEQGDRFERVIAANTFLPTGDTPASPAFQAWREYSQTTPQFHVGGIIQGGTVSGLSPEVIAAYDAPFPDDRYKADARQFPVLVPTSPDDPAAEPNRRAWAKLEQWRKPFLTAFSDSDPVTAGADRILQQRIPGAQGQPHTTIEGGGHFLQEDRGERLAEVVIDFVKRS